MPAHRLLNAALRLAPDPRSDDRDLLAAFVATRDEAAFAELVRRHGSLVLAACRRVTGHAQDAEDAFQAAFLVLARRAGHLQRPEQLGNWLYGVAVRTALDARSARRRIREQPLAAAPEPAGSPHATDPDLAGVVDEELARLPEKYRTAVVLCELEGLPRKDAAARLRVPEGTLSSRLAHARKLLAERLSRRGVALSAGLLAAPAGSATVPVRLIDHTARAAARATGGAFPPGLVSDRVTSLTDGVLKAMLVSKLRLTAGAVVVVVAAIGAATVVGQQPATTSQPAQSGATAKGAAVAPAKAPEKVPAKGIEDVDVPYPAAPAPAVVRLEEDKLVVRQRARKSVSVTSVPAGQADAAGGTHVVGRKYDASDVLVFDMKGNRLAPKAWREKFQKDQHVLIAWGGVLTNPRELVLFKDDTLLVVLPQMRTLSEGTDVVPRTHYQAYMLPDGTVQYRAVTSYEYAPAHPQPALIPAPPIAPAGTPYPPTVAPSRGNSAPRVAPPALPSTPTVPGVQGQELPPPVVPNGPTT